MHILQINSSIYSGAGQSSRLAARFVAGLLRQVPGATLTVRDLSVDPVPHLTADRFAAFTTPAALRTREQAEAAALSDRLIGELKGADVIVLGLPMYNFAIPSSLKAYFDHVARAGVTFRFTESGSVGLVTGKKAYVFTARGGKYAGTPADTQTQYVRDFLAFLGITDAEFVHAEGLAMGDATREASLSNAQAAADRLLAPAAAAA